MVHPQAGDLLEESQHHLAVPPAVDEHVEGAEVGAVGGEPQEVGGDPVELAHQHPDPVGPRGTSTPASFSTERQ